jgi:hypothetical protein
MLKESIRILNLHRKIVCQVTPRNIARPLDDSHHPAIIFAKLHIRRFLRAPKHGGSRGRGVSHSSSARAVDALPGTRMGIRIYLGLRVKGTNIVTGL